MANSVTSLRGGRSLFILNFVLCEHWLQRNAGSGFFLHGPPADMRPAEICGLGIGFRGGAQGGRPAGTVTNLLCDFLMPVKRYIGVTKLLRDGCRSEGEVYCAAAIAMYLAVLDAQPVGNLCFVIKRLQVAFEQSSQIAQVLEALLHIAVANRVPW